MASELQCIITQCCISRLQLTNTFTVSSSIVNYYIHEVYRAKTNNITKLL